MASSVNLVLKHSSISNSVDETFSNAVGSWTGFKRVTKWRVNLLDLLGADVYHKHSHFILRLNSMAYNNPGEYAVTESDQSLYARISGLSWTNSSFDVRTQSNAPGLPLLLFTMPENISRSHYLSSNVSTAVFSKTGYTVDIQIEILRTIDDAPPGLWATLPHFVWAFSIIPIPE
jgi:hypothetical protein